MRLWGIIPTNSIVYSQEPCAEVYCLLFSAEPIKPRGKYAKRGKMSASESRLILVLLLIG